MCVLLSWTEKVRLACALDGAGPNIEARALRVLETRLSASCTVRLAKETSGFGPQVTAELNRAAEEGQARKRHAAHADPRLRPAKTPRREAPAPKARWAALPPPPPPPKPFAEALRPVAAAAARKAEKAAARRAAGRLTRAEAEQAAAAWAAANPPESLWGPPVAPEAGPALGLGHSGWSRQVAAVLAEASHG